MRTIPTSLLVVTTLAGGLVFACSQGADRLTGEPVATGAEALTFALSGDGHSLTLHGAPADAAYEAQYKIAGFTKMTVKVDSVGALSAVCEAGGAKASCKALPFFSSVATAGGQNHVKVVDLYGHKLVDSSPAAGGKAGAPASVPSVPSLPFDAGALGALGACTPDVNASVNGCSMTIDGTSCDCSDCDCIETAIVSCLADAGLSAIDVDASALPGLPSIPGLPGIGGGAGCDETTIDKVRLQFCADVNAKLLASGVTTSSLDCAQIGDIPTSIGLPPAAPASVDCAELTHDAFVKVRQSLATCNPATYLTWDSSARLQLVEDGACDPFF